MTARQTIIVSILFIFICIETVFRIVQYHTTRYDKETKHQTMTIQEREKQESFFVNADPFVLSSPSESTPSLVSIDPKQSNWSLSHRKKNTVKIRIPQHQWQDGLRQNDERTASVAVRNCCKENMIVLVLSSREEFSARKTIRETWAKGHDNVFFVTGASCTIPPAHRKPWTCVQKSTATSKEQKDWDDSSNRLKLDLEAEQQKHQDIIFMKHVDVYRTLALKLKAGYDWVVKNTAAEWILKIDTDCVVRVSSLEAHLTERYDSSKWVVVAAGINKNSAVVRHGKWAEYPEYTNSRYPPWPSGAGHVISRPLARYISENRDFLFDAQGEDVSLGIWMDKARALHHINYYSDQVFIGHSGDCHNKNALVIGHQVSLQKMQDCFSRMDEVRSKANAVVNTIKDQTAQYKLVISQQQISYYFPQKTRSWSGIVYGILSHNKEGLTRRNQIRNTWCKNQQCLFILAGSFGDNAKEMQAYQDVLCLEIAEVYSSEKSVLPYKTQTFLSTVYKNVPRLTYAVKVDDDSFVFTDKLTTVLQKSSPDYWGFKFEEARPIRDPSSKWFVSKTVYSSDMYPVYCSGSGYALSRQFLSCIDTKLATFKFMPREDVATGLLAQACNVTAVHAGNAIDTSGLRHDYHNIIIQHYVKAPEAIISMHKKKVSHDDKKQEPQKSVVQNILPGVVTPVSPDDSHHYMYGYYDKREVDDSNTKILLLQIPFYNHEPQPLDTALLGWVDGKREFHPIEKTQAWNMQQGAMAEWISPNEVMFNVRNENNSFNAVIYKTSNYYDWTLKTRYDLPVYAFDYLNYRFVSISFARLHNLRRGYGYTVTLKDQIKCPQDDGIWVVDRSGVSSLLFTYENLKQFLLQSGDVDRYTGLRHKDKVPTSAKHYWWVNHLMWSSDGVYLSFIVRASSILHGHSYQFSTLMMANVNAKELWRVPLLRGSHPFHEQKLLNCEDLGSFEIQFKKSVKQLPWQKNVDGHCSKHPRMAEYLTDTYPTPKKKLIIVNNNNKKVQLGEFAPDNEGPVFTRCDLHPRWSRNGDYVLFDSTHIGQKRAIYKIDIFNALPVQKSRPQSRTRCKNIFFDLGANIGMHARFMFESEKYSARNHPALKRMYDIFDVFFGKNRNEVCVFGIEANQKRCPRLQELTNVYRRGGKTIEYLCPFAAWNTNDTLKFKDIDGIGHGTASKVVDGHEEHATNIVSVDAISTSEYVLNILQKYKPVNTVMKMDIEGAEFVVLPHMQKQGLLCQTKINVITIEYHHKNKEEKRGWKLTKAVQCEQDETKIIELDSEDYVKDGIELK